ncbi:kinase-like domain-containing protein [Mycena olivaceomarginata]|nr:kinase-like domain-containing protein [Mycena olivaceomarginata]
MAQKPAPGTSLTTSTLLHHEHGGGPPGEDKVMVVWAVRESKAPKVINADLGSSAKKWAVSVALPDIKSHLVETLNLEWTRSHSALLLPEEVTFRWHGGILLEPNTANMTLGQFYAFYSTPSRAPIYLTTVPTQWKTMAKQGKTPTVFLELYIDSTAFTLRQNFGRGSADDSDDDMGSCLRITSSVAGRKRTRTLSSTSEGANRDYGANKRCNSSAITVHKVSPVTLKKIVCIVDHTTGVPDFEESLDEISGNIRDSHFGKGAMKYAYDFKSTDGQALVAKRFYRISDSDEMGPPITVLENRTQIYLELRRLMVGAYFLKQFFMAAKRQGVDVYTAIEFADAWLGQEIQVIPTKASGAAKVDDTHEGITWLVETKRATTVEHFTFTLNHQTRRQDLCAKTIHAFAHFTYGNSQKSIVLADIQGTPAHRGGRDLMILFDPMTHTPAGDSGIGDFGVEGIRSFIQDHHCGDICRSLGLHESVLLSDNIQPNEDTPKDVPSSTSSTVST